MEICREKTTSQLGLEAGGPIARLVGTATVFCALWCGAFTVAHFIIFFYNVRRGAGDKEMQLPRAGQEVAIGFGVIVGFFGALYYFASFYSDIIKS